MSYLTFYTSQINSKLTLLKSLLFLEHTCVRRYRNDVM